MIFRRAARTRAVLFSAFFLWGMLGLAFTRGQILRELDEQSFAALTQKHGPHLDVRVKKSGELVTALKIYTGTSHRGRFSLKKLKILKITATRALIPYQALSPGFKHSFLQKLWPKDRLTGNFWRHTVRYQGHETLWSISQLYTGSGKNHRAIRRASGLRSDRIRKNTRLKIPKALLLPILRSQGDLDLPKPKEPLFASQTKLKVSQVVTEETEVVPAVSSHQSGEQQPSAAEGSQTEKTTAQPGDAPDKPAPKEKKTTTAEKRPSETLNSRQINSELAKLKDTRKMLGYGRDAKGRYAQYRLKSGEAIYSAVVVRFCGLVRADDVNQVAREIIRRNGIRDETDLPIGFPIRIPYDYLVPEYRENSDEDYLTYIQDLEAVARLDTALESRNLEGVYLILDAGHGGRDPGTVHNGAWEDDYVYDIVCRIKKRLEKESAATVITTVLDPSINYRTQNVSRFKRDRDELLLTHPRYGLNSPQATKDGVNLRWVMANHHYSVLTRKGVKAENILFASIHAESLHPSIRGGMVYIPDTRLYPRNVNAPSRFKKYREYKGNRFKISRKEIRQAQALSMNFATHYMAQSKRNGIRIYKQKPIRSLIYRNPNRPFVPAVIKYNRVPTRCLFEICNLNNKHDRALIRQHGFRQKVANAFVDAVYGAYGLTKGGPADSVSSVAASPGK